MLCVALQGQINKADSSNSAHLFFLIILTLQQALLFLLCWLSIVWLSGAPIVLRLSNHHDTVRRPGDQNLENLCHGVLLNAFPCVLPHICLLVVVDLGCCGFLGVFSFGLQQQRWRRVMSPRADDKGASSRKTKQGHQEYDENEEQSHRIVGVLLLDSKKQFARHPNFGSQSER